MALLDFLSKYKSQQKEKKIYARSVLLSLYPKAGTERNMYMSSWLHCNLFLGTTYTTIKTKSSFSNLKEFLQKKMK